MQKHDVDVKVDSVIRVGWSNGAGVSFYRLVDNPGAGPHLLERVADYEWEGGVLVPASLP